MEELGALGSLLGDLSIKQEDAIALLANLPDTPSPERKSVIPNALTLVGKVNYFWGGKGPTLGWDIRWGTTMKVTAAGSPSTGTYRPMGWIAADLSIGYFTMPPAATSSATAGVRTASTDTARISHGVKQNLAIWFSIPAIPTSALWAAGMQTETC